MRVKKESLQRGDAIPRRASAKLSTRLHDRIARHGFQAADENVPVATKPLTPGATIKNDPTERTERTVWMADADAGLQCVESDAAAIRFDGRVERLEQVGFESCRIQFSGRRRARLVVRLNDVNRDVIDLLGKEFVCLQGLFGDLFLDVDAHRHLVCALRAFILEANVHAGDVGTLAVSLDHLFVNLIELFLRWLFVAHCVPPMNAVEYVPYLVRSSHAKLARFLAIH